MVSARSHHNAFGGVNTVFCDGHVAWITNSIAINTWRALSTTVGGEIPDMSSVY